MISKGQAINAIKGIILSDGEPVGDRTEKVWTQDVINAINALKVEKMSIEFTESEMEMILKYMEYSESTSVQNAIMNAISIAFDDADNNFD